MCGWGGVGGEKKGKRETQRMRERGRRVHVCSSVTTAAGNPLLLLTHWFACAFQVGDFASTPTWDMINGAPVWTGNKFPGLYEICKKESKFPGPLFMSAFLNEWEKVKPTDYRKQAVLFRAFLMSGCAGNFNQLFSGNGLIYTGERSFCHPGARPGCTLFEKNC